MKNKRVYIALVCSLLLFNQPATAQPYGDYYAGAQYAKADYNEEGISASFEPSMVVGRFGKFFNPHVAVEARLGLGLDEDIQFRPELGMDGKLELNSLIGVYLSGHLNLTASSSLYAIVGSSRAEAEASVPAFPAVSSTETESDISYGVGANIGILNNIALNIEYMQYLDADHFDLSAIAVGALVRF
ncbi:MAG: porin family protein [Gammaproteobacteria bacterium]|nr:porin family protein [Gammaproteobacteria bacterium]